VIQEEKLFFLSLFLSLDCYSTLCYSFVMIRLMTKEFSKWAVKHCVSNSDLVTVLDEVEFGSFEADLGGHVIKKRIRFQGQGKSGSSRTIICFKRGTGQFLCMAMPRTIKGM
jgi:hypothetical protein